jgi:hypothetical protein
MRCDLNGFKCEVRTNWVMCELIMSEVTKGRVNVCTLLLWGQKLVLSNVTKKMIHISNFWWKNFSRIKPIIFWKIAERGMAKNLVPVRFKNIKGIQYLWLLICHYLLFHFLSSRLVRWFNWLLIRLNSRGIGWEFRLRRFVVVWCHIGGIIKRFKFAFIKLAEPILCCLVT